MWLFDKRNVNQFVVEQRIEMRPNAGPGLWLMFLQPFSIVVSAASHPIVATTNYKTSAIFALGFIFSSIVFVYKASRKQKVKPFNLWIISASVAVGLLFRICLHRGLLFCIYSGVFSTIFYQKIYWILLEKLPKSFTLGEAAICCQSFTLLFYSTLINIFDNLRKPATSVMQTSTLVIQMGFLGLATIILLTYLFEIRNPKKFYFTSAFVLFLVTLLPLHFLLKRSSITWILEIFLEDLFNSRITICWSICSIIAIGAVSLQIKRAKKASSAVRKIFHILAVTVFIPGLLFNCSLLYLASGVVLALFFALETIRITNMPPLAQQLQNGLVIFSDEKDAGFVAFTPMYLLAGCALPLWIHPSPCDVTNSAVFNLLPLLSGVLTVGIGDTAASIIGSKLGRIYWSGSNRTVEGSIANVLSQGLAIYLLMHYGFLKITGTEQFYRTVTAVLITSLVEAKTDQVDNLVLPFVMYIIMIT